MEPVKLLLVDDQDLIRESLHIVLEMDPDIRVTGLAENGQAALEQCEAELPDIVLMDIHMPVMNGVEATREIKARWPEVKVIILTTFQEIDYVVDALSYGAEGYLLKAIHPKDLVAGIKWVHSGGTLIPQDIARLLIREIRGSGALAGCGEETPAGEGADTGCPSKAGTGASDTRNPCGAGTSGVNGVPGGSGAGYAPEGGTAASPGPNRSFPTGRSSGSAPSYGLSERELQVLQCVAAGLNNKEIAERLFLSEGTVKNYISSIYSKMDVRDRIQAANKARDEGLL